MLFLHLFQLSRYLFAQWAIVLGLDFVLPREEIRVGLLALALLEERLGVGLLSWGCVAISLILEE